MSKCCSCSARFPSARASQPATTWNAARSSARGPISIQRFASEIDLTKAKRGRSQIQLRVDVVGLQSRDLRPPGNGFLGVLFFGRVGQDVKRRKRIVMHFQDLARDPIRAGEILLLQHRRRAFEQTRFAPARVKFRTVSRENDDQDKRERRRNNVERNSQRRKMKAKTRIRLGAG